MQKIGELFNMGDVRATINEAQRPKRDYNKRNPSKIKKPTRARFKAQITFNDGNTRYFHSLDFVYDYTRKKYHIDEFEGLNWLFDYIRDNLNKISHLCIYAHTDVHPLTENKRYQIKVVTMGNKWITYYAKWAAQIQEKNTFLSVTPLQEIKRMPRLSL
jgi:hypothetical protein